MSPGINIVRKNKEHRVCWDGRKKTTCTASESTWYATRTVSESTWYATLRTQTQAQVHKNENF